MTIDQVRTPDPTQHKATCYDRPTIILHWLTAGLVISLFALALVWDLFEHGSPLRKELQSLHISLGILLTVVIIMRIGWRATRGRHFYATAAGIGQWAAKTIHLAFYFLLILQIGLGFGLRWAQAESFSFFGLFPVQFSSTENRTLAHTFEEFHDSVGWIIIILVGLHAAAALIHHYVLRDDTLKRML
ncbi:MAG: cytochrome b [Halothiobacillus sp.]